MILIFVIVIIISSSSSSSIIMIIMCDIYIYIERERYRVRDSYSYSYSYDYICIRSCSLNSRLSPKGKAAQTEFERVLEYGVRAPVFYGRKRFSTKTYRNIVLFLQKSPETPGSLRENVI